MNSRYSTKGAETVTARHISRQKERYEHQRNGLEKKYRSKTVGFDAMLIVLLWYAIVTTVFAAIRSGIFLGDFTAFFEVLWNGIRQSCKWIVGVAKALAQVGDRIPNEMIAIIVHWLLFIIVIAGVAGVIGVLYSNCRKESYEGI